MTNIKLTNDRAAAVNTDLFWLDVREHKPPRGARMLLINEAHGVAVIGTYSPEYQWTHWQALPKFQEKRHG